MELVLANVKDYVFFDYAPDPFGVICPFPAFDALILGAIESFSLYYNQFCWYGKCQFVMGWPIIPDGICEQTPDHVAGYYVKPDFNGVCKGFLDTTALENQCYRTKIFCNYGFPECVYEYTCSDYNGYFTSVAPYQPGSVLNPLSNNEQVKKSEIIKPAIQSGKVKISGFRLQTEREEAFTLDKSAPTTEQAPGMFESPAEKPKEEEDDNEDVPVSKPKADTSETTTSKKKQRIVISTRNSYINMLRQNRKTAETSSAEKRSNNNKKVNLHVSTFDSLNAANDDVAGSVGLDFAQFLSNDFFGFLDDNDLYPIPLALSVNSTTNVSSTL